MAKAIKKYRVRYAFEGGGNLIVTGTSKEEAQTKATELLLDIVPILRPYSAKTYSNPDIIPNELNEDHTRDVSWVWSEDTRGKEQSESLFGETPTQVSWPKGIINKSNQ